MPRPSSRSSRRPRALFGLIGRVVFLSVPPFSNRPLICSNRRSPHSPGRSRSKWASQSARRAMKSQVRRRLPILCGERRALSRGGNDPDRRRAQLCALGAARGGARDHAVEFSFLAGLPFRRAGLDGRAMSGCSNTPRTFRSARSRLRTSSSGQERRKAFFKRC